MKILRRYALRELLTPFLISLLFFTFIFLVGNLVKLADLLINKGVSLLDILKILVLLIPKLLSFTLPTSALTAILLTFGGFAQNNEITAMKANGVNLLSVMVPVLLASFFLSLVSLFFNDQIQSRAQFAYRQAVKDLLLKRPMAYLEAGKFIKDFQDYIILTQRLEGNRLYDITIYQPQEEGKATRTIIAEWGEIISSSDDKTLTLKLYNGTSDEPNPDDPSVFYKLNFKTFELPPIHLGKEDPSKISKKAKDMSLDEILYRLKRDPEVIKNKGLRRELKAEFHKKISFSFAPFVFALVGLPLAVITRRGEAVISFSLAIGIVAFYYVFFVWSRAITLEGYLPPFVALWLPNLFMAGCGIFLIKRILAV
ncbi:MAG: LptF/LptG family permease [Candidatus Omnitrophica bacterium]|nr:LptF/LptG family permease [Candidatus Omnitrophota bacterium]